jgi:pyruvate/2-oxoglutarate dehydrogenase complex dihydrolipoamide acyltransferase (E2) component
LGVDLTEVEGTGVGGKVTVPDVVAAAEPEAAPTTGGLATALTALDEAGKALQADLNTYTLPDGSYWHGVASGGLTDAIVLVGQAYDKVAAVKASLEVEPASVPEGA